MTGRRSAMDLHRRRRRRRRVLRRVRSGAVSGTVRLARRTESVPVLARALTGLAGRLDLALKRVEGVVAPHRPRAKTIAVGWSDAEAAAEYRTVARVARRRLKPVGQPLVLITQAPRSGGTLLMRLFDGHPQCHAVPHELGRLLPSSLPLPADADGAWRALTDPRIALYFAEGLRQAKGRKLSQDRSRLPLLLPPLLQRELFEQCLQRNRPQGDREILDCYLTSYFNAWLDYGGLGGGGERRWVTGFEPFALVQPGRLRSFRRLYPDGRLLSILRRPADWFASAARWRERYRDEQVAAAAWHGTVEAALALKEESPETVALLSFEALVSDTEATMRAVADFLDIDFTPDLLTPTFNGTPLKANSSFPVGSAGVITAPLERREGLSSAAAESIEQSLGDLYRRALGATLPAARGPVGQAAGSADPGPAAT